jgi:hypothetical protein
MAEQPAMDSATETQTESVAPMPKSRNVNETAEHLKTLLNTEASKTQETASEESTKDGNDLETNIEDTFEDDELIDQVEAEETTNSNEELYKLTVNGQEVEVTLDELRKGYSRQQDYTQKTEKLSQDRKTVDQLKNDFTRQSEEAKIKRDQYEKQLQVLSEQLKASEKKVDLDKLYENDPAEYVRVKAEQDRQKELLNSAIQEKERIQAEKQEEYNRTYSNYLEQQRELLSKKLPIYADKDKGPEFVKNLTNFAKEIGYSDQEISQLVDHRAVMMLANAYRYDKLKKANLKNKKVTKVSKVISSSSPKVQDDSDVVKRMNSKKATLKKTGKVADAVSILEQMYSQ